ncbi:amidase [Azospirillum argentinense]
MSTPDLFRLSATEMAEGVRNRRFRARDLVAASLERIAALDGGLKSFITVAPDAALAAAEMADRQVEAGSPLGPLHGVPVGVKDLTLTAGLRTTYGSTLYADLIPDTDDLSVARLKAAGAIIVGKTNTPEFGFGAITGNELCGPTANPYDLDKTSGGSSGGSAAAVAAGLVPLAQGTDFGGSVRTPASFCGVVGLRPTPGRIPSPGRALAWDGLATQGFLARDVADAALALAAVSGPDPRDPTSLPVPVWTVPDLDALDPMSLRVAWSTDLGSALIDLGLAERFEAVMRGLDGRFGDFVEATPDCREASAAFGTLRAAHIFHTYGRTLEQDGDRLSPSVAWNIARGKGLTAADYLRAEAQRSALYRRFAVFFRDHDILMTLSASVPPFPNAQGDVTEINGFRLSTIIDYLAITYTVSLIGFPCLSIPCGWTADGLPIGLQLIARPYEEDRLLRCARFLEREMGFRHRWPEGL